MSELCLYFCSDFASSATTCRPQNDTKTQNSPAVQKGCTFFCIIVFNYYGRRNVASLTSASQRFNAVSTHSVSAALLLPCYGVKYKPQGPHLRLPNGGGKKNVPSMFPPLLFFNFLKSFKTRQKFYYVTEQRSLCWGTIKSWTVALFCCI